MSFGLNKFLKIVLPKSLFYRALIIVAAPVILLQIIITIVFFDSVWIKANKGMTRSLVAEIKLNKLIDEVMEKNELQGEQIAIGGFSQGCMISLQTAIKRKKKINSIIGYSGKIIDTNHLKNNIITRPNIILMHGDKDEIVPVSFLLEAKEFFNTNNYRIESQIFKNCEHRIPIEGSSLGLEFLKKNLQ
mgnify:CR=1 FL=1